MSLVELSRENATCLPSAETADLLGDAIVRDGLTNHSEATRYARPYHEADIGKSMSRRRGLRS